FFQAEDGIRYPLVTGVQTCALPIYSLLMAPHNVCGPVGTMANLHFAVCTPNYKILEHFNDFADPWLQDLVDEAPHVDEADGCFGVPERPGLGVRLNHDAGAQPPRPGGRIRALQEGRDGG